MKKNTNLTIDKNGSTKSIGDAIGEWIAIRKWLENHSEQIAKKRMSGIVNAWNLLDEALCKLDGPELPSFETAWFLAKRIAKIHKWLDVHYWEIQDRTNDRDNRTLQVENYYRWKAHLRKIHPKKLTKIPSQSLVAQLANEVNNNAQ